MKNTDKSNYKYVFVCGLQRSGTSMLGRNIARLENCTGFKNTGVLQDEGQYLQDVYPDDGEYGGTGRFGFDLRAHLTETSSLLTPENGAKLRASCHCYGILEDDKKHLKCVYDLRYEDYIQNPDKYHQEIARFIGTRVPDAPKEDKFRHVTQWPPTDLRVPERAMEEASQAYNKKYFDRWSNLLNNSIFRRYYRYIAMKYEPRVAKYGYSLTKDFGVSEAESGNVSNAVGTLCCLGADAGAFLRRLSVRIKLYSRIALKAVLPEFVIERIRQARERQSLSNDRAEVRG